MSLLALAPLLLLSASKLAAASPCVAFDSYFNLYAFGLNGKDFNAGQQSTWAGNTTKANEITASGRPPFDGTNTTCYLSQFYNSIYVMNGDKSNPSDVHIFNAATNSWSTQTTTTGKFDPTQAVSILDHDTNVFYSLVNGELFFLDMGALTAANSSALSWVDVEQSPYGSSYKPVMALAQNHIHFIDVPGLSAGSADIFVIHYSWFQPDAQSYGNFPQSYGQATAFFQSEGVQQEFVFIPEDSSSTYVINVETNTTATIPAPAVKDPAATYFAGITSLVQLTSNGTVMFLPYLQGNTSTNSAASWDVVGPLLAAAPPSATSSASASGTASGKGTATSGSTKATGTSTSSSSSGSSSSSSQNSAAFTTKEVSFGLTFAATIAAGAMASLLF